MKDLMWTTEGEEKVFSCPIFDIATVKRTAPDGRKGTFVEVLSPDWIVAMPWFVREDGVPCFVMEEQFRHGSSSVTREFPAGLVEKGESALEAAKRELMEETGMEGVFTQLGCVNPNSAFMTNRQTFFLVENVKRVASQSLDPNEEIVIVSVPVEEAIREMAAGMYDNGIMMMAIGFFLRLAEKRPELRAIQAR